MATIAFLGLGNMGGPMAKNLIAAGHSLTVFDLVEAACAALQAEGASVAASAAEAAANAEVIISMLPAGKHVAATFLGEAGLLANISTETLILDASTIDAATLAPSAWRAAQAASTRSKTVSECPAAIKFLAMGPPILPRPRKAIVAIIYSGNPSAGIACGAVKKVSTTSTGTDARSG